MDWKVIKKHDSVINRRVEEKSFRRDSYSHGHLILQRYQNNKMREIKVYMTNNSRISWYTYIKRKR